MIKLLCMNERQEAEFLLSFLNEKITEDVICIDTSQNSSIANYVIICSCSSSVACRAVAGFVEEKAKNIIPLLRMDGEKSAEWIVLDFASVIVHVFIDEVRKFYNLEKLLEADKYKIN